MDLPFLHRIYKANLKKKDDPDMLAIVESLNRFTRETYRVLDGYVDFKNLDFQKTNVRLSDNELPYKFNTTIKHDPEILLIGRIAIDADNYTSIGAAVTVEWEPINTIQDNGEVQRQIKINALPGTSAGVYYNITFLIM